MHALGEVSAEGWGRVVLLSGERWLLARSSKKVSCEEVDAGSEEVNSSWMNSTFSMGKNPTWQFKGVLIERQQNEENWSERTHGDLMALGSLCSYSRLHCFVVSAVLALRP